MLLLGAAPPDAGPPAFDGQDQSIVVTAAPHCRARAGDPQDAVAAMAPANTAWYRIVPDLERGGYKAVEEPRPERSSRLTPPGVWQRAGSALPDFVFRVPEDEKPLCIGAARNFPRGWVQLQQMLHSETFRCKYVRFTAFIAGRKAKALLWMNNAEQNAVKTRFDGNHLWTPVELEVGPVKLDDLWVGFGVALGEGDVWIYRPHVDVIPASELSAKQQKVGRDCEKQLETYKHYFPNRPLPDGDAPAPPPDGAMVLLPPH